MQDINVNSYMYTMMFCVIVYKMHVIVCVHKSVCVCWLNRIMLLLFVLDFFLLLFLESTFSSFLPYVSLRKWNLLEININQKRWWFVEGLFGMVTFSRALLKLQAVGIVFACVIVYSKKSEQKAYQHTGRDFRNTNNFSW